MSLINTVARISEYVMYAVLILCVLGGGIFLYFYKYKKKQRMKENDVDYSGLKRMDSADFVKFDDIKDDMIILNNGRRYVAAIQCQGFDFYSAQLSEQGSTAANFLAFIGTLDKPVTFRQHSQAIDMDDTRAMYTSALEQIEKDLYNIVEDRKDLVDNMRRNPDMSMEDVTLYEDALKELDKKIKSLEWREFHVQDQLAYIDYYSGEGMLPDLVQLWIYEWEYDELDFVADLGEEEIYKRAVQELHAKTRAMIHSLGNCGVKARRCSTEELIEINRRYSSPISANRYKLRNIMNSAFFEDIVTSSDVYHIIEQSNQESSEEMGEIMFDMMMDDIASSPLQKEFHITPESSVWAEERQEALSKSKESMLQKRKVVKRKPVSNEAGFIFDSE